MSGEQRLLEACAQLEVGETRFHQLRELARQGALSAIEPRPAGRPSRAPWSEAEQIRALQARIEELELALHEAQVREEIALVLPHLRRTVDPRPGGVTVVEEKKRAVGGGKCASRAKPPGRGWGSRPAGGKRPRAGADPKGTGKAPDPAPPAGPRTGGARTSPGSG